MGDPLLNALEQAILRVCEQNPQGVADNDIREKLGEDVKPQHRLNCYNKLLSKGRLRLLQKNVGPPGKKKKVVLYQWVSEREAGKMKGLDVTERMVYNLIENAGQAGLTKRDIKFRANIQNTSELKQIAERLMTRGLIKEIKSVQGANKRVYIISELEPSAMHTGGPWYNDDQEFDNEFISAMYEQVLMFTRRSPYVTVDQVASYVAEIKLSNETLSVSDIRALMHTMLYDSAIEECEGRGDGGVYYRQVQQTPAVNHLASIPCGSCPVFHDCVPGGVISPQSCVYMKDWMKGTLEW